MNYTGFAFLRLFSAKMLGVEGAWHFIFYGGDLMEEWKDIVGFGGRYEISSLGTVRNKETGKVLKPCCLKGYPAVRLCFGNRKYPRLVHRLVAEYFIPNPKNYPVINHKDENPLNYSIENLEWCTAKYNMNYGTSRDCHKVPVVQLSLNGEVLGYFNSISEASEKTGTRITGISDNINGRNNSSGGYKWKYADRESGWKKAGKYSKELLGIKPLYMQMQKEIP